jgi:hypothetical protein
MEVQGIGVFGYSDETGEPRQGMDPQRVFYGAWKEKPHG